MRLAPLQRPAILGWLFLAALPLGPAGSAGISFQEGTPQGTLLVSRPVLRWRCRATGGARIASTRLLVNDRLLPSQYSTQEQAVVGQPDAALPPGDYTVTCRVTLAPGGPFERGWRFRVGPGAITEIPPAPAVAHEVAGIVNELRRSYGLGSLKVDARLSAAASAHERYRGANPNVDANAHMETEGRPGFIGPWPGERVQAFGYGFARIEEGIGHGQTPAEVVRSLWSAPYHRLPLVDVRNREFGASLRERQGPGLARYSGTLLYGTELAPVVEAERLVVAPRDGERDVPPSWLALEQPDPLRLHSLPGTRPLRTGFPITVSYFAEGEGESEIRLTEACLTVEGANAPLQLLPNTPERDQHLNKNQLLLIPRQPLLPGTNYRLTLVLRTGDGRDLLRDVRFSTAAGMR